VFANFFLIKTLFHITFKGFPPNFCYICKYSNYISRNHSKILQPTALLSQVLNDSAQQSKRKVDRNSVFMSVCLFGSRVNSKTCKGILVIFFGGGVRACARNKILIRFHYKQAALTRVHNQHRYTIY